MRPKTVFTICMLNKFYLLSLISLYFDCFWDYANNASFWETSYRLA